MRPGAASGRPRPHPPRPGSRCPSTATSRVRSSSLAQWADARKAAYATSYASIGLAPGQAEAFHADADAFGAAIEKQEAARLAYRSATDGADAAAARLTRTANGCVKSVRGFAEAAADPAGVLGRAMLSPRKTNTPRPAPTPRCA